jgi:hypothetical protein
VGAIAGRADILYAFAETGTSNSISFTVPTLLTGNHEPFTEVIGLTVGGFTIADAVFAPFGASSCCAAFAGSGTNALNCGIGNPNGGPVGNLGTITNPTAVGVYSYNFSVGGGGFPS